MRYNPAKHHRRSIRLKEYDYSTPGAYFVNLCAEQRECCFGEVGDRVMRASDAGRMIEHWWGKLPEKFPSLSLDEWVLMPNHLHGILVLGARSSAPSLAEPWPTLGEIVGWFKTMTTNEYIRGVKNLGWRCFPGRLWQRDFFDHVIRSQEELESIREYIRLNPSQWDQDSENPAL